ncbi:putative WD repeat-containing protein 63 [Scophthalmus maximus]|uniref:Putative WD repeat-containing protein 63 n=1 Tax=Scophthalmus maximus TaxID=52904 RepID=A0A2U9C4J9_SCOMX|nr:putative WD repeat-containing protein 63 [Scophthalmus maximus]
MPPKKPKSAKGSAGGKKKGKNEPPPEEKPDHPEDILPMVLTSVTQELFDCRADEDVTAESPYKLLQTEDIIQDIKTRAGVSDFSPVKQIVLDYPDDEILLVYDRAFTYGQLFYLVLTPEAKDRILNPPEPEETQGESEWEVCRTPESKEWISLGSELEIEEESVKETREKLLYKFSRVRRELGKPVSFSDRNTADAKDGNLGFASYEDSRFSIKLMQRDCGTQAVSRLQSSSVQTQWKFPWNKSTQYAPRELSEEERKDILQSESLKNFCNLVTPRVLQALQQEEIMNVFRDDWMALGNGPEAGDWSGKDSKGLMLHQAFTDHKYTKDRKISSINWHPTIDGVIAVALTVEKEQNSEELTTSDIRPSFIVFFCFSDPSHPQLLLESPGDILAFKICPSDPNIIVGGCMNGQVVLWDISAHVTYLQRPPPSGKKDSLELDDNAENVIPTVRPCAMSTLENSHKGRITDVKWLPATFEVTRTGEPVENKQKMSVQVVTCSPDRTIMFWDVRVPKTVSQSASDSSTVDQTEMTPYTVLDTFKHLGRTWRPLLRISLLKISTKGEYTPLKFNFEPYTCDGNTDEADEKDDRSEILQYSQLTVPSADALTALPDVNTKLYIGTEDGEIVYTDWRLEKDDSGQVHFPKPLHCFRAHYCMVNTIQRSPFFKDIILTAGGFNFAIWKEGVIEGPIILSPNTEQVCTVGCWSLSRPAVFFIGKDDGSIEVWNLLEQSSEPVEAYLHVTNAKITCITPWISSPKQHFLAVTDELGMVRILEIPKKFFVPGRTERSNVRKYFEQDKKRLLDYLQCEEMCKKEKKESEKLKKKTEPVKPVPTLQEIDDMELKEYRDCLTLEENILKGMGLWTAPPEIDDI